MQNKKLYLGLGLAIILIGAAAFVGGRMLNSNVGNVTLGDPEGVRRVTVSIDQVTPAPELPNTPAEVTGKFVERNDNAIMVQAVTFGTGLRGVSNNSPMDEDSGVKVEVIVTSQTVIYKDVTEIPESVNGEILGLQQAAGEGTLDDLSTDSFVTVWGRRSGDRIIADVLFYSNPKMIEKP